ncbi:hypothetical protein Agabi119p4_2731 [Agaricus bisporus var. burnettii]|uniref:DNA 3'-5' helicase n=2 Tax=Agaricus bisporus var. burnettii TaxID=192524 RepID=A0A8H7F9T2_AGABI|nr:hypothetical protein Agabi119p4_2731 [Agaricus bisporus var. burnettii]
MKRIANAEETVNLTSRDKRSKVASSQDKCDVCLEPMEMSGKSSHPGCIKKSGFLALPKENKAFKLARDSVDNKVPCPKCMFRDFNLDVVKQHLRSCSVATPTAIQDTHPSGDPQQQPYPAEHIPEPGFQSNVLIPREEDEAMAVVVSENLEQLQRPEIARRSSDEHPAVDVPATSTANLQAPFASHTIQPPLLRELGLLINTLHQVLVCISCRGIINPHNIREHFFSRHKFLRTRVTLQKEFNEAVLRLYPDLTDKPSHPTSPVDPIYGLPAPLSGHIECATCHHCYMSSVTFGKHSCDNPRPLPGLTCVQQFRHFSGSPWFPVKAAAVTNSPKSPWQMYKANSKKDATTESQSTHEDYRIFNQFLYKEGWIQQINGRQHESLTYLTTFSTVDPAYGLLHKHVVKFLADAQDNTRVYYLRRLISTRPAEEHDVTRVRHHRSVNPPTIQTYARVVSALISFLHRITSSAEHPYSFAIPSAISTTCEALISLLHSEPRTVGEEYLQPEETDAEDGVDTFESDDDSDVEEAGAEIQPPAYRPHNSPQLSSIQNTLFSLLYLLYTQLPSAENRGDFSHPISHYLLLSSLRRNQEWARSSVITQTIAALLFTGRLVFAHKINDIVQRDECTINQAFSTIGHYFNEETETIMPNLYLIKRGLSSLHSAEESSFSFNAPDLSGTSAIVEGLELNLHQIGALHTRAIGEITQGVDELTFYRSEFRLDNTVSIFDEPHERKPGYSFVTDQRNPWNHRPSLLQHILDDPSLFEKYAYFAPDGTVSWISSAVAEYVKKVYDLQIKIMCIVILTYGEPARGTELASHLLCNVGGGSIRNFFVLFNLPVLRASFNKTTSHSGFDHVICRFPLPELKTSLLRFLVHVRPVFVEWQQFLRPHMAFNAKHMLFAGLHTPINSHDISSVLAKYTKENLNIRLNLRTYRQYMAFITSCNHSVFAHAAESEAGAHEQFGHSAKMNVEHYGHDSRTPSGMNIKSFNANARVSAVFHVLYGHPPTLFQHLEDGKSHSQHLIATIDSVRRPKAIAEPLNVLTNHPTNDVELLHKIKQLLDQSIASSHAAITHLFSPSTNVHNSRPEVNDHVVVHPFVLRKLRESFPELHCNMSFSNQQQAEVAQMMLEGKSHIVYISPTGSGKTTPAMLSAKSFDCGRSTIFLLPLVAMHIQYQHAAERFELTGESWNGNTSSLAPPTVIFATIDHATLYNFKTYVKILVQKKLLARIVIDEAHLILTHADFRPVMSVLQWLASTPVPIVIMTATLPPTLEKVILNKIGITTARIVRALTSRPNISFRVVHAERRKLEEIVKQEFTHAMAYGHDNRVLVFCLSVNDAIHYGRLLGIPSCYSGLGYDELSKVLRSFRDEPSVRALATTSILGVGLDIPSVTHTIHVGFPRDVISYIQEAGRAGRRHGDSPAFSIVVLPPQVAPPQFNANDHFGKKELYTALLDNSQCRRIPLQTFLDGQAFACSMLPGHSNFCDVCELQSMDRPPIDLGQQSPYLFLASQHSTIEHSVKVFEYSQLSQDLELVHNFLRYFSTACVACALRGPKEDARRHLFRDCQNHPSPATASQDYRQFKTKVKYSPGTCYQCGISQKLKYTNRFGEYMYIHEYTLDASQPCLYADIVLAMAFSITQDPNLRREMGQKLPTLADPNLDMLRWMTDTEIFALHSNVIAMILCSCSRND